MDFLLTTSYTQLILIVIYFLFISNKPPFKEIWLLSTFSTSGAYFFKISVTEAYILKPDILVIVLFAMFLCNNESQAISIYYSFYL